MKTHTKTLLAAMCCAAMTAGSVSADVLGVYGFTDRTTETTAMTAESVATGVTMSRLFINDSFEFFGLNNLPVAPRDGYGFGNATNDIFLDRASFFDDSAVPNPRPTVNDWTSFGSPTDAGTGTGDDMSANANAPLAFTVTAGAGQTVTINSVIFDRNGATGGAHAAFFQEAGATGAAIGSSTGINSNTQIDVALASPVVINPGETKSFTILINSSALDTRLTLDSIALNGTVVPEPGSLALLAAGGLCVLRRRRG